jgi:hypothetical protein
MKKITPRWTEWILTLVLLVLLISLIIIAKIQSALLDTPEARSAPIISIEISGEVEKPGIYSFEAGTPLSEFLKKAKPNRFANLRKLTPAELVRESRTLYLEELDSLTIEIAGREVIVPVGTRVCDLKRFVSQPDLKLLKSQRLLKDGEKIFPVESVDK